MNKRSYFYSKLLILFLIIIYQTKLLAEPNPEIFDVTINELMARPTYFDGIKVRVIAVANLDFSFEAQPALYASKEDWKHWTGNLIDLVGDFEGDAAGLSRSELEKMNGEYVILEGIFKYRSRENLKIEGGGFKRCWPRCRHYWIEKVTRLNEWKRTRKKH